MSEENKANLNDEKIIWFNISIQKHFRYFNL